MVQSAARPTLLTADDLYLFNEGTHARLYEKLGSHPMTVDGVAGTYFAVWAPDAREVHVAGDFNGWDETTHALEPRESSGVWEGFIAGVGQGTIYKYAVTARATGRRVLHADPYAIHAETPPRTGSIVWEPTYEWGDSAWMAARAARNALHAPFAIYECHLGSWMRVPEDGDRSLSYREIAPRLAEYLADAGFTHVELLPVMEHPFYGSWGYQSLGYFAPTSRYGTPEDFMYLVDTLHQEGIGVILDWVPSHFPTDEHGLAYFDGTHLYEHADPRRGLHPDWDSYEFNCGRHEVRSFLISSAVSWLDRFHADGLRVDAVASMLYLDYSRKAGEWLPNRFGGREDLDAVDFLRQLNTAAYGFDPAIQVIAEESTSWPMVSRPTYVGGLGFGMKWDMGWMHDTLEYMRHDPVHRRFHQGNLTFRGLYAFTENFVLSLSHDEVVHGKGSMLGKMSGDDWQKRANLRLLYAYQWLLPGKKLIFMGSEFGQWAEWDHDSSLEWHLLQADEHSGIRNLVRDLNHLYRSASALHATDFDPEGFEWIDANDSDQSTLSFLRRSLDGREVYAVACNFTPVPRPNYRLGVPFGGHWVEVMNTDASWYGGSGQGNLGGVEAVPVPAHGRSASLVVNLPPLAAVVFHGRM